MNINDSVPKNNDFSNIYGKYIKNNRNSDPIISKKYDNSDKISRIKFVSIHLKIIEIQSKSISHNQNLHPTSYTSTHIYKNRNADPII